MTSDEKLRVARPIETQHATLPVANATVSATQGATPDLKALADAALRRIETQPASQQRRNSDLKQEQLCTQQSAPKVAPLCTSDRVLILAWLAYIEATREEVCEVMERCANNPDARAYYLKRASEIASDPGIEQRRQIVLDRLRAKPGIERAFEVIQQGDEFRVAVAIRGKGTCELSIPADRWNPQTFLELLEAKPLANRSENTGGDQE